MNSIFGRYNFKSKKPIEKELIIDMCHAFDCYGAGEEEIYCEKEIGLGVRHIGAVSIKQLIFNENGQILIAFDGTIYNSKEINNYLSQKGHLIKTNEYAELVVHLYEEMGEDCVRKINGVFSFALWDKNLEKFFLFRDRLGCKSIFYIISNGALIFASEIKSILQNEDIKKEVDLESLHYFLSYNYVSSPNTLFKNIRKLPPGCYLQCSKAEISVKKYWDLQFQEAPIETEGCYTEKFSQLLEIAVRRNLVGSEPVGLLLSGGIDSSSIGFFMAHLQGRPIKTFTLGFSDRFYNADRETARTVSQYLGTVHYETFLDGDKINIQTLKEIINFFDDPIADPAAFAGYYISKFVSRYAKVVLSGEGGDELLAGYESYVADKLNLYFTKLPFKYPFKYLFSYLAGCLPVSNKPRSLDYKIKCFFQGAGDSSLQAHCRWRQFFSEEEKERLLKGYFLNNDLKKNNSFKIYEDHFNMAKTKDLINRFLYVDLKTLLPDCCLRMFDIVAKSASIEIRTPFLDQEVVEFLFKIPSGLKLRGFTPKYLLKRAMVKNLPHKVLRRQKRGLSAPINIWINREWRNMILDILHNGRGGGLGYFNQKYIQQILNEHFNNTRNNSWKILSLINFCLWHELYIGS